MQMWNTWFVQLVSHLVWNVPILPATKDSNENGYWLARVSTLNSILPGQVTTTGMSHFMLGLHSRKTLGKSNIKFPFKILYSCGLGDWKPHSI